MEHTFMTIHNLSPEANILFASESIHEILGYQPHEVQNRSCFDYFHPEEVPFAKSIHNRGVLLDKAAVLHYARILSRDGRWVSCECCFTVVHDVLVACTSIYQRGEKSNRRALEAPQIRRLFACSPRDPRYHMLEHLSPKFRMEPPTEREPRAALILNRFTRTLTVMFATNAVASILGVQPDQIKGKSFYECIQENCLQDAIRCLESAKANDSIAYLRFWYRDPRREEDLVDEDMADGADAHSEDARASTHSSDSEGGGAQLYGQMDVDRHSPSPRVKVEMDDETQGLGLVGSSQPVTNLAAAGSGSSSGEAHTPASDPLHRESGSPAPRRPRAELIPTFELEAVVSCTSDGLVVVLRKARPAIPQDHPHPHSPQTYQNGLFAAPWGHHPIEPHAPAVQPQPQRFEFMPRMPIHTGTSFPSGTSAKAGGPPLEQLMRSIRDVAVFAWALVGINGSLASHSRGVAQGEAQPVDGFPVWDPTVDGNVTYGGPENQAVKRWAAYDKGKQVAPSLFTGPYQLNAPAASLQQPLDSGYSTQLEGNSLGEPYGYAEPPSVREAWSKYRQQQQHLSMTGPTITGNQFAPSSYQFGAQTHSHQHPQGYEDPFRMRPRQEPDYHGQAWSRQNPAQPSSQWQDGHSQYDIPSTQEGHPDEPPMGRYPWN